MTLKEFIDNLNKFVKVNPETLDMEVICSNDSEGNSFSKVLYPPSKGFYENKGFIESNQYNEYGLDSTQTNAVCIN